MLITINKSSCNGCKECKIIEPDIFGIKGKAFIRKQPLSIKEYKGCIEAYEHCMFDAIKIHIPQPTHDRELK